ncbi:hypothetical protein MMPV_001193 [Pyropia vietnamensis]
MVSRRVVGVAAAARGSGRSGGGGGGGGGGDGGGDGGGGGLSPHTSAPFAPLPLTPVPRESLFADVPPLPPDVAHAFGGGPFAAALLGAQAALVERLTAMHNLPHAFLPLPSTIGDDWGNSDVDDAAAASTARTFHRDVWASGVSCVLESPPSGGVFEKAAVNVTVTRGAALSPARAAALASRHPALAPYLTSATTNGGAVAYTAAALSLVVHPAHPHVPTLRADVRVFCVPGGGIVGGGADLTPVLLYPDDARAWHVDLRAGAAAAGVIDYAAAKAATDAYFYLPWRREHRGVGGVFFEGLPLNSRLVDALTQDDGGGYPADTVPTAVAAGAAVATDPTVGYLGELLATAATRYGAIVSARSRVVYGPAERRWQLRRRGRYVEFNLLADRGVAVGLAAPAARPQGVMVSAPPVVRWDYAEEEGGEVPGAVALLDVLRVPRAWADAEGEGVPPPPSPPPPPPPTPGASPGPPTQTLGA